MYISNFDFKFYIDVVSLLSLRLFVVMIPCSGSTVQGRAGVRADVKCEKAGDITTVATLASH